MRGKMVLLMGPPATGKSSLARDIVNWYRVTHPSQRLMYMATDGLREWLCGREYLASLRPVAYRGLRVMAESVVVRGHHVLLDGNYLEKRLRQPILTLARRLGSPLMCVMTTCPESLSRRRNAGRNHQEKVPDEVIKRAFRLAEAARQDADLLVDTSLGDPSAARKIAEWLLDQELLHGEPYDGTFRPEWESVGRGLDLAPGQVLWTAGQEALEVALLLEGRLEVLRQQQGLPDMVIGKVEPGELLGELSTFDGQPHSATLRAATPCRLSLIQKPQFHDLLRRYPGLLDNLLKGLASRVRSLSCSVGKSGIDVLTGLANRRLYEDVWPTLVSTASQHNQPLSLALFDVDSFKSINDTWGHESGDLVLKHLAQTVRAALPEEAVGIRLGGDEFLVLLPGFDLEQSHEVMQRLVEQVANRPIEVQAGIRMCPTLSVGIASFPKPQANPEELMQSADEAAYESKKQGRNRITLSTRLQSQTTRQRSK